MNTSWAYAYEDRGTNIHTVWDSSLNNFVVRHKDGMKYFEDQDVLFLYSTVVLNQNVLK